MGKRCRNCANGKWLTTKEAVSEICLECKYVFGEPSNWKEKVMTNADRIRAMGDEELAKLLLDGCRGSKCSEQPQNEWGSVNCFNCRTEWLKQPAEVPKGD